MGGRPDVVSSAIRSTVSDDAGVPLTQWSVALTAEEAGHVPVQIWGHIQSEVIINILLTAMAHLLVPCHWGIWREREREFVRGGGGGSHVAVAEPVRCSDDTYDPVPYTPMMWWRTLMTMSTGPYHTQIVLLQGQLSEALRPAAKSSNKPQTRIPSQTVAWLLQ